jgi:DNA-directed RNA polymerase specialized sigma24 family protein
VDRKQVRAFEGFVAESGDALLRMATLLTSGPHLAEDIYQETLQRLAMQWPRVGSPMAFCRRVMHNHVINQARARSCPLAVHLHLAPRILDGICSGA